VLDQDKKMGKVAETESDYEGQLGVANGANHSCTLAAKQFFATSHLSDLKIKTSNWAIPMTGHTVTQDAHCGPSPRSV
jgi:hypothetical protein